jgi:hypothetical protein
MRWPEALVLHEQLDDSADRQAAGLDVPGLTLAADPAVVIKPRGPAEPGDTRLEAA